MTIEAIGAIATSPLNRIETVAQQQNVKASFVDFLVNNLDVTNQKLVNAEQLTQRFAIDGSVPLHQVTFALEEARMSFELAMQVRSKMVEAYQQFMSMQI
jgi:flagellar hook-basal body complex protein FliE